MHLAQALCKEPIATTPRIAQAARAATTAVVQGLKKVAPAAVLAGGVLLATSDEAQAGVADVRQTIGRPGVAAGTALVVASQFLGGRVAGLAKEVVGKLGDQAETLLARLGRTNGGPERRATASHGRGRNPPLRGTALRRPDWLDSAP